MKLPTKARHLLVAAAVSGVSAFGAGIGPAGAAYGDCPTRYNCWFSGVGGQGKVWRVAGSNLDLNRYFIAAQSGSNRGTSGRRACGYRYVDRIDLNYSRPMGGTATFSARPIRSNRWTFGHCPNG